MQWYTDPTQQLAYLITHITWSSKQLSQIPRLCICHLRLNQEISQITVVRYVSRVTKNALGVTLWPLGPGSTSGNPVPLA